MTRRKKGRNEIAQLCVFVCLSVCSLAAVFPRQLFIRNAIEDGLADIRCPAIPEAFSEKYSQVDVPGSVLSLVKVGRERKENEQTPGSDMDKY